MAEVELDAVLQFFRKNGLSECESALMEDIVEKSRLQSSDFEKFCFPMVPPPPPLRITAARAPQFIGGGGDGSTECSSSDDFVSLDSSTSDFTNPYGIHTTRTTSEASSDRLSQFGTARDYPDFDMQNDLLWYKENDQDLSMPPLFDNIDFDGDPSEDKFILSVQTGERIDDQPKYNPISEWALASKEMLKSEPHKEKSNKKSEDQCSDYTCLAPLCACCNGVDMGDPADYSLENLKITDVCDHESNFSNETSSKKENDDYSLIDDEVITGEPLEPETERLMYDKEDDYEIFNLRIIHRKNRTGFEENKEFPIVLNSVIAGRYYVTEMLGSAAFSRVVQAHDLSSGMDVCLKIIKNDKEFFDQSLDEIKLLKYVNKHDPADEHHILRLYDYFYHQEHLFIVTELLRANLYEFQKYNQESGAEPYFTMHRLQVITQQCLEAISYLHDLGVVHCDLKPENILIKSYRRCEIKVIDLGSSCFQTDDLSLYVQSRSYRAPEVILGLPYDQKIDVWSVGCILAELYSGEVLFPNEAIAMILSRMVGILGPVDTNMLENGLETHKYFTEDYDLYCINEDTNQLEYIIPDGSSLEDHLQTSDHVFVDFLKFLLEMNPKIRPTAREALHHPWLNHPYEL
ncbi:hypothetical protein ACS0TY_000993 [Phlomoides rotata]